MNRKVLSIAACLLFASSSCLVVGKNVVTAQADSGKAADSQVIVYAKDDKAYAERLSQLLTEDVNEKFSMQEKIKAEADNFVYTSPVAMEYALDDETHSAPIWDENAEIHCLTDMDIRGNYVPTSFWNLDSFGSYQYRIVNMHQYAYTDYYFNVSSSGYIVMGMGTLDSGGNDITIRCYECGTYNEVMSWTGNPQSVSGLGWPLNKYKTYYFKFEINTGTLSGNGTIYH